MEALRCTDVVQEQLGVAKALEIELSIESVIIDLGDLIREDRNDGSDDNDIEEESYANTEDELPIEMMMVMFIVVLIQIKVLCQEIVICEIEK